MNRVDDAAAASLARDPALNVTGTNYTSASPILKRMARVAPLRQLAKLLVPAKLRGALHGALPVKRQYPTTSREERWYDFHGFGCHLGNDGQDRRGPVQRLYLGEEDITRFDDACGQAE